MGMEVGQLWASCTQRFRKTNSQVNIIIGASYVVMHLKDELVALMQDFNLLARMVDTLGVFSSNETVEDVSTSSLPYQDLCYCMQYDFLCRYMKVNYYIGMLHQKKTEGKENRLAVLKESQACLLEFLRLLKSYALFRENLEPNPDPMQERMQKIDRFKRIKALEASIEGRREHLPTATDEEFIRSFYLDDLEFHSLSALQELGLLRSEIDLLSSQGEPAKPMTTLTPPIPSMPLRRVTRPFTLLKSSKEKVLAGVFKPGHNLPTMTIDEYLEIERQRGGILSGGTNETEGSEDEDRLQDDEAERQKAIRMDAYKDDHRRGSGNTYNRG